MQPGSNHPGALPREILLGSERVVYEAHPGARRLHPFMFWVPIPIAVFFGIFIVAGALTDGGPNTIPVVLVGFFLLVLPFVAVTYRAISLARKTTYGLTDQRVILRVGDDNVSLPYTQVAGVSVSGKSDVVFSIRPDMAAPISNLLHRNPPSMVWKAVSGATALAAYARSASQYYSLRIQQAQIRQDLVRASIEDKVFCEYCGGFSTLSQIDPNDPRCPRCRAPIVVAPAGIH